MIQRRVGNLSLFVLDDGTLQFPAHFFFRNVPEAEWRKYVDVDADGKIPVAHNFGLLANPPDLILIDTGYGDETHSGQTGHLLEEFDRTGYRRDQVTLVVLTHAHGDHIKRATIAEDGARTPTFPLARYYLGRADWHWFNGPGHVPEFDEHIRTLQRLGVLMLFEGDLQLTPEVRLLSTPGHTPGHTCVVIESDGETVLVLGDLCHLPVHFEHPDWVSTFDTHPTITPHTRKRIFKLALERDALVLCSHAPAAGLGHIRSTTSGFHWQPD